MTQNNNPIKNRIWNRNFIDWIFLLIFIVDIPLILILPLTYSSCVIAFSAGGSFIMWLFGGMMNDYQDLVDEYIKLNKRILNILQEDIKPNY